MTAGVLAGWSGWRWSGLVLIGRDPDGVERSLGELDYELGRAVLLGGDGQVLRRQPLHRGARWIHRALLEQWVSAFGGRVRGERLERAVLDDLAEHPGTSAREIACRLDQRVQRVGSLLWAMSRAGLVRRDGSWQARTWTLAP